MNVPQRVLLVGPLLPPVHGQALAFTRVYEHLSDQMNDGMYQRVDVINTNASGRSRVGRAFKLIKTLSVIMWCALIKRYDVVYFTCSRSVIGSLRDVLLVQLSARRGARVINHLHGSDLAELFERAPRGYAWLLRSTYELIDTTIVLLESMRDQVVGFERMRVEAIPNFYDDELNHELEALHENLNKTRVNDREIKILYLSNLIRSKGILELIDAFRTLASSHPHLTLSVAGNVMGDEHMSAAELKSTFEHMISEIPRVTYHGPVFGEDKARLFQSADIFALPSYFKSEASPLSILEAMSAGNAIIATRYKYLPDLVPPSRGVLVEPRSVDSLRAGIESLLDRDRLAEIQAHNQREARERYTLQSHLDQVRKIINDEPTSS